MGSLKQRLDEAIRNLIAASSLVMYFMHLNFVGSYVALMWLLWLESEQYVSINLNYQKTAANLNNPNVCMCMTPFAYYLSCALN